MTGIGPVTWRLGALAGAISETFVSFVIFVVNKIKVIVPGYPHRGLMSLS